MLLIYPIFLIKQNINKKMPDDICQSHKVKYLLIRQKINVPLYLIFLSLKSPVEIY